MPELPEVELLRRGLSATLTGLTVSRVEVRSPNAVLTAPGDLQSQLVGHRLVAVRRRGKLLILDLDRGVCLLVHLMMTGQVVVAEHERVLFAGGHPSASLRDGVPGRTTRVIFTFAKARMVYFNDARRFGRLRVCDASALAQDAFLQRLGPEPLSEQFTLASFRRQLQRHARASIKSVILDQRVVAGVGNIYAGEALHLARVHPAQRAGELTATEAQRLRRALRHVLSVALTAGGTSFADYADPNRPPSGYFPRARVFRRAGQPCRMCGTSLVRLPVASRGTVICPCCQPLRHARLRGQRAAHRSSLGRVRG